MKYLVVVLVVVGVLWWLKQARSAPPPRASKGRRGDGAGDGAGAAEPMVSCAHCGVHLPQREAVRGVEGSYCSDAHRLARGD